MGTMNPTCLLFTHLGDSAITPLHGPTPNHYHKAESSKFSMISLYYVDFEFSLIAIKRLPPVKALQCHCERSEFHKDMICQFGVEELSVLPRAVTSTPLTLYCYRSKKGIPFDMIQQADYGCGSLANQPMYRFTYLPICPPISLPTQLIQHVHQPIYLPTYLSNQLKTTN